MLWVKHCLVFAFRSCICANLLKLYSNSTGLVKAATGCSAAGASTTSRPDSSFISGGGASYTEVSLRFLLRHKNQAASPKSAIIAKLTGTAMATVLKNDPSLFSAAMFGGTIVEAADVLTVLVLNVDADAGVVNVRADEIVGFAERMTNWVELKMVLVVESERIQGMS